MAAIALLQFTCYCFHRLLRSMCRNKTSEGSGNIVFAARLHRTWNQ